MTQAEIDDINRRLGTTAHRGPMAECVQPPRGFAPMTQEEKDALNRSWNAGKPAWPLQSGPTARDDG
eukprot:6307709-Pyramimonas_sp.AAC.1